MIGGRKMILLLLLVFTVQATSAMVPESIFLRAGAIDAEPATEEQESVPDIGNIIFEHVLDSYEWHLTEWKGKPVAIHLPVILIDRGIHAFNSREILETGSYGRWHIAPEGAPHEGKIVREDGSKPFDISITKNVLQLMINALLLVLIVLLTARWYKRHDALKEHPTGIAALMEPLIMMIHDMARENIGEDDYRRYSPYLLTAFLFILLSNVIGIIPFFPGGANLTGNIACTLVLALFTFFTVNLTGTKHYYKEIFSPDVPGVLKPLMAVIETFSALVKPGEDGHGDDRRGNGDFGPLRNLPGRAGNPDFLHPGLYIYNAVVNLHRDGAGKRRITT